ncbi:MULTISPECIES: ABC transporter permease [Oceanobacillus]|uniref:ABC transporter permease n=1 Tax=Oceanobacillus indicireducens TaxID=1004261 RepID=A0A917XZ39_9BACI|nr:iron ABC transporter permease [Oceanobacillus indicireducens]GGN59835.1 ABC transporter permease [Oceanobacillus indicireducens]
MSENSEQNGRKSSNKIKNLLRNFFTNPVYIISFLIIALLSIAIVYPLIKIAINTFQWSARDFIPSAVPGEFTLYHWITTITGEISSSLLYQPMANTLAIGASVSVLALTLGAVLAWLVTRTDIPFKKTLGFMMILPYMFPSWFKAFVWLIIFKNDRVGGSPGLIQYLFSVGPPDWLSYGFVPIVLTLTSHYYVFSYLLVGAALSTISSSLEESANILGASKLQTMKRITFPLVLPAILSAFILIISKSLGSFGVPAFLGLPVRYYTMSTMIYSSIGSGRPTEGYILSIILIVLAALIIYFNQKMISKKNYETIGGKDSKAKLITLGKWKKFAMTGAVGFVFIVSVLPVVLLLWQTLMLKDGDYSLSNMTLHYWIGDSNPDIANGYSGVFKNSTILSALKNSVIIALTASVLAAMAGLIIGYIVTRSRKMFSSKLIDQLSFLPYLIPGIALSAIYLSMSTTKILFLPVLYGTLTILILITVVKELPFATRAGTSTMIQIGGELEEAAKVSGASWFKRFFRIMLPLSKSGLFTGFIIVFISAMKELDLIIMLVTPSTNTLTAATFGLQEQGYPQIANASVAIIIFIIVVVYLVTTIFGKTDISKGIGGGK